MSRIGKQPITLPEGVSASLDDGVLVVKGPKGELTYSMHKDINAEITDKEISFSIGRNTKIAPAMWGTVRSLASNMVKGVTEGWTKKLEMHGVGYRASLKGDTLELLVGFSHPVSIKAPSGIEFNVEKNTIIVSGIDACQVGQVASDIRAVRKPEPYKGKGIRYAGEQVRRKVGKVVGTA